MKDLFTAFRALVYMTGFIGFFVWIALNVRIFDKSIGVTLSPWTRPLGILFMAGGGILGITCVGVFVIQGRGTQAPFDPPKEFVQLGPYRYVRNPMYLAGLTGLFGFGLYHQSVSILFLSVIVFSLAHIFVLAVEEPGLGKKFGQSYLDYKKSAKRWIPTWK